MCASRRIHRQADTQGRAGRCSGALHVLVLFILTTALCSGHYKNTPLHKRDYWGSKVKSHCWQGQSQESSPGPAAPQCPVLTINHPHWLQTFAFQAHFHTKRERLGTHSDQPAVRIPGWRGDGRHGGSYVLIKKLNQYILIFLHSIYTTQR